MKRLMVIDALNLFIRNYVVNPSISTSGSPIGGLKGFLQSIQKLSREINPDYIVVVWDGPGGSKKRKTVVKEYKSGRKPVRLNRNVKNLTEQDEIQNKIWQQARLIEYLNEVPIVQFLEPMVEADDIISFVVQTTKFKDWQKVVVSSDKDFIQLCDEHTVLYRPIQDEILNRIKIVEQYGIHPNNFALARALAGDKSDNLPGVPGIGLGTIAKRFSFLSEEKSYTIQDIVDCCDTQENKLKAFVNILENQNLVKTNYKMMQLYTPSLSVQVAKKIKHVLNEADISFNNTEFKKMMIHDGFGEYNWKDLEQCFRRIVVDNKNSS